MHFKLKKNAGRHQQREGDKLITYKVEDGGLIESDDDLCEMFPNKFERVNIPTVQTVDTPDAVKTDVQKSAEKGFKDAAPDEEDKEPLGKNLTPKFEWAEENDFSVFYQRGKGYFVTEKHDPYIALNDDPLRKADVIDFIEIYLEEIE